MRSDELSAKLSKAMNKLAKWRTVFAGWQLGTRADTDPECQAVRDHREVTMFLRVEQNALAGLLVRNGVISLKDYQEAIIIEADLLDGDYERRFPGFKTTQDGLQIDAVKAAETTKGWRP